MGFVQTCAAVFQTKRSRSMRRGVAGLIIATLVLALAACVAKPSPLTVTGETSFDFEGGMASDVMFWVPLSAPIDAMSLGDSTKYACSKELTSWLTEYGSLITTPQAVLVRSAEDEELSVELRAEGSRRPADAGFVVQCGRPGIAGGEVLEGELEWNLALVRLAEGEVEVAQASEDGPRPLELAVAGSRPLAMLALLQGDEAFDGKLVASTPDAQGMAVPLRGTGGEASTDLHWPGIPPSGTLRVAVAEDIYTGETAFLCSAASEPAYAATRCEPDSGPQNERIQEQAIRYRDNYVRVQERERLRTNEAQPTSAPDSATKLTRLDPWADPALSDKPVYSTADSCYRDAYRLDRISCAASLTCYLNRDETRGACRVAGVWEVFALEGLRELPPEPDFPMEVEMLRLHDGTECDFSTGAGPFPPDGFDGWVGSCHDGQDVLWAQHRDVMPLDQTFLFEPISSGGRLRIAAGREGEAPTFYEVDEIFY